MEKKRLIIQWIGFFMILSGLCVICWPFIMGHMTQKEQDDALQTVITEMEQAVNNANKDSNESKNKLDQKPSSESYGSIEVSNNDIFWKYIDLLNQNGSLASDELRQVCIGYNEGIFEDGQSNLISTESTESFAFDTRDFGFAENTIGAIWVPRLDVQKALYLGSNRENMKKGAAILATTSIPMSSGNINSAIAGHRGHNGTPVFRDIQEMQIGDPIYIVTPWEVLTYRVCELRIVPKNDNNWCLIQEGRNLITLMTCHPYGYNYQRYIVFAEYSDEPFVSTHQVKEEMETTKDSSPREVKEFDEDGNMTLTLVDSTSIDPDGTEYGAAVSNIMILAESKMIILLYAVGAFTFLVFVMLLIRTRRYLKEKKK